MKNNICAKIKSYPFGMDSFFRMPQYQTEDAEPLF